MKSSHITTLIIAIVLAGIAFFIAQSIEVTGIIAAAIAFISAILPSLFISKPTSEDEATLEIKTLYVGNLPYRANEGAVRALFAEYGQVQSVRLMKDKQTGKRRGFGFVEISASDADHVIRKLNDSEFQQRTLKVREAKERPEKSDDE
ncbi:RNA recognition motif domain-containing protein [Thalassotalea ganghwensis]